MGMFEQIIDIPACYINRDFGQFISDTVDSIAEDQRVAEFDAYAKNLSNIPGLTDEQRERFMEFDITVVPRKDRWSFGTPNGIENYIGPFNYSQLPEDVGQLTIEASGIKGQHLSIQLETDLERVWPLHTANRIRISGDEKDWVNSLYKELDEKVRNSKDPVRNLLYRLLRSLEYIAFLGISSVELRIVERFHPTYEISSPLTGLTLLIVVSLYFANFRIISFSIRRVMRAFFPYFELQDRTSHRRKKLRGLIIAVAIAILSVLVTAIVQTAAQFLVPM